MTDDLIRRGDAIAKIKERASGKSSSGLVLTVDAAIDALAALPRSSSQRSKERAMTDAELIARLRKDDTDFWHCEAADRIEALIAENAKLHDHIEGVAKGIHKIMVGYEAKLAKAVEALSDLMMHEPDYPDTIWEKSRATLAEIKGT